jgi:hypothetical protein
MGYVPFDITNKRFASNLHDIMLGPRVEEGVDFWAWCIFIFSTHKTLDWQKGSPTSIPNLNPTFWLNHIFFQYFQRLKTTVRSNSLQFGPLLWRLRPILVSKTD